MNRIALLDTLSVRAALLITPSSQYPELVDRLNQFISDRGAVGLVYSEYVTSGSLEEASLVYWNSRIEKSSTRLEDIISALLLGVCGSILAHFLITNGQKITPKVFAKIGKNADAKGLTSTFADMKDDRISELERLLAIYRSKLISNEMEKLQYEQKLLTLYGILQNGGSFREFYEMNVELYEEFQDIRTFEHLETICKGVLLSEEQKNDHHLGQPLGEEIIQGLPLSDAYAFGEIIFLDEFFTGLNLKALWMQSQEKGLSIDELIGVEKINEFIRVLETPLLYSEKWSPAGRQEARDYGGLKKIICDAGDKMELLLLSKEISHRLDKISGFILLRGGMTSHMAVISRGLGKGAIGVSEVKYPEIRTKAYAAIREGTGYFFDRGPEPVNRYKR